MVVEIKPKSNLKPNEQELSEDEMLIHFHLDEACKLARRVGLLADELMEILKLAIRDCES